MDLQQLDTKAVADRGSWLHLRAPSGELLYADEEKELPMRLLLLGSDSDVYRKEMLRLRNERLEAARNNRPAKTAEAEQEDSLDVLVAVTKDCQNILVDGELVEPTRADLRRFYRRFQFAVEQAGEHINRRDRYLGNSLES